jgi:DNA-binding XRE family transcriptional regulator
MLEHYIMKLLFMKQKTKTDLCVDIGVSRQTYYNWIRGTHIPTFGYVMKIAELLSDDEDEKIQIARQFWILIFETQMEEKTNEK